MSGSPAARCNDSFRIDASGQHTETESGRERQGFPPPDIHPPRRSRPLSGSRGRTGVDADGSGVRAHGTATARVEVDDGEVSFSADGLVVEDGPQSELRFQRAKDRFHLPNRLPSSPPRPSPATWLRPGAARRSPRSHATSRRSRRNCRPPQAKTTNDRPIAWQDGRGQGGTFVMKPAVQSRRPGPCSRIEGTHHDATLHHRCRTPLRLRPAPRSGRGSSLSTSSLRNPTVDSGPRGPSSWPPAWRARRAWRRISTAGSGSTPRLARRSPGASLPRSGYPRTARTEHPSRVLGRTYRHWVPHSRASDDWMR